MSNSENHVKSDTIKWILTLIAFIIVGVMLAGIICGWFTPKETPTMSEPEVTGRGAEMGGMPNLSVPYAQGDYTIGADVQTTYTLSVADGYSDENSKGEFINHSNGYYGFDTVRFNGERAGFSYGCFDFST